MGYKSTIGVDWEINMMMLFAARHNKFQHLTL